MIRKSIDYEKKVFDQNNIHRFLNILGNINYVMIEKKLEENEIEEIVINNIEDVLIITFPEKVCQFSCGLSSEAVIVLLYQDDKLGVSITAENIDSISEIKNILEIELALDELKQSNIRRFEELRKKNSYNPEWVEVLMKKFEVWIELRDKKLYLDGSFSADELIYIANEMNKKS